LDDPWWADKLSDNEDLFDVDVGAGRGEQGNEQDNEGCNDESNKEGSHDDSEDDMDHTETGHDGRLESKISKHLKMLMMMTLILR
jgi:hypothetical protein